MRVVRSWPAVVPDGRCYVQDTTERLVMSDYDYRVLSDVDDDVVLIEWDLAVDRDQFDVFLTRVAAAPDDVLVAPYKLYAPISRRIDLEHSIYAHRRYTSDESAMRFVTEDDHTCHLFGFGLVYLPRALVGAYLAEHPDAHFDDGAFSGWHYRNVRQDVPIAWETRPVHLHPMMSAPQARS